MSYKDYLKSKDWEAKRNTCYKIARYKCHLCTSSRNLHAHHMRYGKLVDVKQKDLLCLCKDCHFQLHDFIKEGKVLDWKSWKKDKKKPTKKKYKKYLKKKYNKVFDKYEDLGLDGDCWGHMNSISDELNGTNKSILYSKGL